jgi:hypothetical protein
VSFVVEKDGSVADVEVVSDPGQGAAEEAKRVLLPAQMGTGYAKRKAGSGHVHHSHQHQSKEIGPDMKKLALNLLLFVASLAWAQGIPRLPPMKNLHCRRRRYATDFPGGIDAFYSAFTKISSARSSGLVDKVVLSFVIEKDGTPTDIRVVH